MHRHLDLEVAREGRESVFSQAGQEERRQIMRVVHLLAVTNALRVQHGPVEADDVAADEHTPFDKPLHVRRHDLQRGSVLDICRPDAGQCLDAVRYRLAGVNERGEAIQNGVARELDGADLDDGIGLRIETGGLQVQGGEDPAQTVVIVASVAAMG